MNPRAWNSSAVRVILERREEETFALPARDGGTHGPAPGGRGHVVTPGRAGFVTRERCRTAAVRTPERTPGAEAGIRELVVVGGADGDRNDLLDLDEELEVALGLPQRRAGGSMACCWSRRGARRAASRPS